MKIKSNILIICVCSIFVSFIAIFATKLISNQFHSKNALGVIYIQNNELLYSNRVVCPIIVNPKDGYKDYPDTSYKKEQHFENDSWIREIKARIDSDLKNHKNLKINIYADTSLPFVMLPAILISIYKSGINEVVYHDSKSNNYCLRFNNPSSFRYTDSTPKLQIQISPDSVFIIYDEIHRIHGFGNNAIYKSTPTSKNYLDSFSILAKSNQYKATGADSVIWIEAHPKLPIKMFEELIYNLKAKFSNVKVIGIRFRFINETKNICCCDGQ